MYRNSTRMEKHLLKCGTCPKDVQAQFIRSATNTQEVTEIIDDDNNDDNKPLADIVLATSGSNKKSSISETSNSKSSVSRSSTGNINITPFFDNVPPALQTHLNELFARAVYSSGIPFQSIVENAEWLEFFKTLRPAWKVPSRYMLSESLLEQEFCKMRQTVETAIDTSDNLAIQSDGWSNIRHEPVVNFIVSTPEPYIVDTVFTEKNQHTSDYMATITDNLITKYGPQKFLVSITDNAANMLAASKQLAEKYPHLYVYGCIAHMINLIAGDILNTKCGKDILEKSKHCVKFINNTSVLSALFKETSKIKNINASLKMPSPTRWGSTKDCFESVQKCRSILRSIAVSEETEALIKRMSKQKKSAFMIFRSTVLSDNFWENIDSFVTILKPLHIWILRLECDLPTIELTCKAFNEIRTEINRLTSLRVLSAAENASLKCKFQERKACFLKDIHFAADLLRPQSLGSNLSPNELIQAMKCIEKIARDMGFDPNTVSTEVAEYLNRESTFSDPYTGCLRQLWP